MKNKARWPTSTSRRYKMKFCKKHAVFYLSEYGHDCTGPARSVVGRQAKGWKASRAK